MADYNIDVHDHGTEILSTGVVVLLILFFPIGVIVLIARTINRLKNDKTDREHTRQQTAGLKSDTSLSQAKELEQYKQLLDRGIITEREFEAKKQSILTGTSLRKALEHQKYLQ